MWICKRLDLTWNYWVHWEVWGISTANETSKAISVESLKSNVILSCSSFPSSHPNLCLFSLVWVVSLIESAFSRNSGSRAPSSICLVGQFKKGKKMKWICEINHLEKSASLAPPVSCSPYILHSQILFHSSSKWWFWVSHHMAECVKAKYSVLIVRTWEGCQGPAGCPGIQSCQDREGMGHGGAKTGRRSVDNH